MELNVAKYASELAECQDYGDVESLLIEVCERAGTPSDILDMKDIVTWFEDNSTDEEVELIKKISARCDELQKA